MAQNFAWSMVVSFLSMMDTKWTTAGLSKNIGAASIAKWSKALHKVVTYILKQGPIVCSGSSDIYQHMEMFRLTTFTAY